MFNEYWKAKAAKRRKAWAAVAKRFAEKHTQLEEIRKKVYLPLDYDYRFSFEDYKEYHLVEQNPIVKWDQMKCHFTESGLRDAMATEGADLANLTMLVSRESIVGVEATSFLYLWCEIKDAALLENLKVINVSEGMTDHFKQPLSEQYHQFIVE